jgi:hypothetical protein
LVVDRLGDLEVEQRVALLAVMSTAARIVSTKVWFRRRPDRVVGLELSVAAADEPVC